MFSVSLRYCVIVACECTVQKKMTAARQDFRSWKHVVHNVSAHIVLITKYRKKIMPETVHAVLKETIQDTCDRFGIEFIEFNADTDHALALIHYPPKYSISEIVHAFKRIRQGK